MARLSPPRSISASISWPVESRQKYRSGSWPRWRKRHGTGYGPDILPDLPQAPYGEPVTDVPEIRVRPCNGGEVGPDGRYVLYWMTAFRRLGWSFALERAAGWGRRLGRPLGIREPLRCGYRG